MKTIHQVLATTAVAATFALAFAPAASAQPEDPYGFHDYRDRTGDMVTPFEPGAFFGDKAHRPLVISPHGRTQKIECRGDGHYVQMYDCRQFDAANVAHTLTAVPIFGRTAWLYF